MVFPAQAGRLPGLLAAGAGRADPALHRSLSPRAEQPGHFVLCPAPRSPAAAVCDQQHIRPVSLQKTGQIFLQAPGPENEPRPVFKNKVVHRSLPSYQPLWGYYKKIETSGEVSKSYGVYTFLLQPAERDQRENTALAALRNRLTVAMGLGAWSRPKGMV